jgi:hypothetical protein
MIKYGLVFKRWLPRPDENYYAPTAVTGATCGSAAAVALSVGSSGLLMTTRQALTVAGPSPSKSSPSGRSSVSTPISSSQSWKSLASQFILRDVGDVRIGRPPNRAEPLVEGPV